MTEFLDSLHPWQRKLVEEIMEAPEGSKITLMRPRVHGSPAHSLAARIIELGLHESFDDDYEWCIFCEAGVYRGGGDLDQIKHEPSCVVARVMADLR